jgi:hypothetical protein
MSNGPHTGLLRVLLPQGHPPRLKNLLDAALPQPVQARDSRDPGRRGQLLRPSYPQTLERLQKADAKIFRNDEHGDVIVTIKDDEADVAVTKGG